VRFPLGLGEANIYKEKIASIHEFGFVVCVMYTPSKPELRIYADRLICSCDRFKLDYSVWEMPSIHWSIHPSGSSDSRCTKANFICENLKRLPGRYVLYMDVDLEFKEKPQVLLDGVKDRVDFAAYNWLADLNNEAYMPAENNRNLYRYSHSTPYYCPEQLIVSGGVGLHSGSKIDLELLRFWQMAVEMNSMTQDDHCLDYIYNNFFSRKSHLKTLWLDKEYLRIPWWPHIKPVVEHYGFPGTERFGHKSLNEWMGKKRVYSERCRKRTNPLIFPQDAWVDVVKGELFFSDNKIKREKLEQMFWV